MPRFSDLQLVLLSAAASRTNGSLLPFPASIDDDQRRDKAIAALIRRSLVVERDVSARKPTWRVDGERRIGLVLTDEGMGALDAPQPDADNGDVAISPRPTKTAAVIALLDRPEGASLADLIAATGWLPHTTRAALTGLRKKGHAVTSEKVDGARRYRLFGTPE